MPVLDGNIPGIPMLDQGTLWCSLGLDSIKVMHICACITGKHLGPAASQKPSEIGAFPQICGTLFVGSNSKFHIGFLFLMETTISKFNNARFVGQNTAQCAKEQRFRAQGFSCWSWPTESTKACTGVL